MLKEGVSHEVRKLGMFILAENCVYSAFATNKATVFLAVEHMVDSNDGDMGWLLMADCRLQLPFQAFQ